MFIIKKLLRDLFTLSYFTPLALIWMLEPFSWLAKKKSFTKLPVLASKLGLKYEEANYKSDFGKISGVFNEHVVEIKPDEGTINVDLIKAPQGIEISTSRSKSRIKENIVNFRTSSWKFNWIYKTKRINKTFLNKLIVNQQLFILLNSFYVKRVFKLDHLSINENYIFCEFNYGFIFLHYLPASKLEIILKELIEIAKQCENKF